MRTVVALIIGSILAPMPGVASMTIGPIHAGYTVQGTVIGSPSNMNLSITAMDFADTAHGFLATQTGKCEAGGCTNTLLDTTDSGQTWKTIHRRTAFIDLSFVSPHLGFGVDVGGRLLVTLDGGSNWATSRMPAGSASHVDFVDARHGWVLGGPDAMSVIPNLYRTTDAGRSWAHLPFQCGQNEMIGRVSFANRSIGFLLCQVMNGPFAVALYRSDDAGTSWHRVSVVDPMAHDLGAFDFISPQTGFVSAGFGNLLRTNDGGHSFIQVPGTPFEDVQEASWFGSQVGYVSTHNVVVRTIDGGAHWRQMYPAVKPQGAISLTAAGTGIGVGTNWSQADVLRTNNGIGWRQVTTLPATSIDRLVRTSPRTVWAVAPLIDSSDTLVQLFRTTDNGRTWRRMLQVPGGTGFLSFTGARWGFLATTTPFRFYITTDVGATWAHRSESEQTWNDQFVSASSGWAFGSGDHLLHTDDGGRHWQPVAIHVSGLRPANLYFFNPDHGWITGTRCNATPCAPVILRTQEGGVNWTLIRLPQSFAFDGFDWVTPQLGYVLNGQDVYRTGDGGITWRIVRG